MTYFIQSHQTSVRSTSNRCKKAWRSGTSTGTLFGNVLWKSEGTKKWTFLNKFCPNDRIPTIQKPVKNMVLRAKYPFWWKGVPLPTWRMRMADWCQDKMFKGYLSSNSSISRQWVMEVFEHDYRYYPCHYFTLFFDFTHKNWSFLSPLVQLTPRIIASARIVIIKQKNRKTSGSGRGCQ